MILWNSLKLWTLAFVHLISVISINYLLISLNNWFLYLDIPDFVRSMKIDRSISTLTIRLFFLIFAKQSRRKNPKRRTDNLEDLKQELDIDFHKITPEELYQRFQTHPENVSCFPLFLNRVEEEEE